MKKLLAKLVRIIYILLLPFAALVLNNTKRVRVLVRSGDEILLVRGYVGHQRWSLPGGGLKRGEAARQAAIRETYEETGLVLSAANLVKTGQRRMPAGMAWASADITFFTTELGSPETPAIKRRLEIIEIGWWPLANLPAGLSPTVQVGLKYAAKHGRIENS